MAERRRVPKQARSRALWDAILEAGARVLVEQGYEKASTGRIARRAGVSVGSLYQYFADKDAVFTALTARIIDAVGMAGAQALTAPGLTLHQRVALGLRGGFAAFEKHPGLLRQLGAISGSGFVDRLEQNKAVVRALVAATLRQHPAVTLPDTDLAARLLIDATEGLLLNLTPDDDPDVLADEGARLLLAYCGIAPESGA